jgi:hypothetical protein
VKYELPVPEQHEIGPRERRELCIHTPKTAHGAR